MGPMFRMVYDVFDRFKSILSSGWRGMMRCSLFEYFVFIQLFQTEKGHYSDLRFPLYFPLEPLTQVNKIRRSDVQT